MDNRKQQLDKFFEHYAEVFQDSLAGESVPASIKVLYSDYMIGSGPAGTICGKNDAEFRNSNSDGYDFYRKIGVTGMYVISQEHTILDDIHALLKIRWKCDFTRKDKSTIQRFVLLTARNKHFFNMITDTQMGDNF